MRHPGSAFDEDPYLSTDLSAVQKIRSCGGSREDRGSCSSPFPYRKNRSSGLIIFIILTSLYRVSGFPLNCNGTKFTMADTGVCKGCKPVPFLLFSSSLWENWPNNRLPLPPLSLNQWVWEIVDPSLKTWILGGGGTCYSLNAGWAVEPLTGGVILLDIIKFIWTFTLIGRGHAKTFAFTPARAQNKIMNEIFTTISFFFVSNNQSHHGLLFLIHGNFGRICKFESYWCLRAVYFRDDNQMSYLGSQSNYSL